MVTPLRVRLLTYRYTLFTLFSQIRPLLCYVPPIVRPGHHKIEKYMRANDGSRAGATSQCSSSELQGPFLKVRPVMVFFSLSSFSGIARLSTCATGRRLTPLPAAAICGADTRRQWREAA